MFEKTLIKAEIEKLTITLIDLQAPSETKIKAIQQFKNNCIKQLSPNCSQKLFRTTLALVVGAVALTLAAVAGTALALSFGVAATFYLGVAVAVLALGVGFLSYKATQRFFNNHEKAEASVKDYAQKITTVVEADEVLATPIKKN